MEMRTDDRCAEIGGRNPGGDGNGNKAGGVDGIESVALLWGDVSSNIHVEHRILRTPSDLELRVECAKTAHGEVMMKPVETKERFFMGRHDEVVESIVGNDCGSVADHRDGVRQGSRGVGLRQTADS